MKDIAIQNLLKDYSQQNFGAEGTAEREKNIQNFMNAHPELFKWFYEEQGGAHSKNLLEADIDDVYTTNIKLTDLVPGTAVRLVFAQGGAFEAADHEDIIIGATGNYYADDVRPVYGIYFIKDSVNTSEYPTSLSGAIAYQYQVPARNAFDTIEKIETDVGAYNQFVGTVDDLVASLECTREQVTKISMSRYFKRPVEYLYYIGNNMSTLYWDTEYKGTYDYKEHMEYSPFSIYVLRDDNVTINGVKESIVNHIKRYLDDTGESRSHVIDHMFEKYYIDRYINARTAEEVLTERMLLLGRIEASDDEVEKAALQEALAANPVYILDPMAGASIQTVGNGYMYDPAITYNEEPIDLREIQRYDLDNLEPTESKITVGNGVYGDVFYQKVTMFYDFEDTIVNLRSARDNWKDRISALERSRWTNGQDPSSADLAQLDNLYSLYNQALAETIANWVTRESDLGNE